MKMPQTVEFAWKPSDLFGKVHPTAGYIKNGQTVIIVLLGMVMLFAIAWQGYRYLEGTRKAKFGERTFNDATSADGKQMQHSAIVATVLIAAFVPVFAIAWTIGQAL